MSRPLPDAAAVIGRLAGRGETLAAAESLTGGLFLATLIDVPGASVVVRGGVVVYATDLKVTLGGMDAELLARVGPVSPQTATELATSVRRIAGATWGVSMTGVAGPDPQDGQEVGTVYLGLAGPGPVVTRALHLSGDRATIRTAVVAHALALVLDQAG